MEQEDYPGQKREIEINDAIAKAVEAADRIIMEASDGSVEETNYITAKVLEAFTLKVTGRICSAYLHYQIQNRQRT